MVRDPALPPGCEGEFYSTPPPDHVARYEWALSLLRDHRAAYFQAAAVPLQVLDVGCGSGYGMEIFRSAGFKVQGIDRNQEALTFGRSKKLDLRLGRYQDWFWDPLKDGERRFFGITMLEVIEHDVEGMAMLKLACQDAEIVLASVPEDEPVGVNPYHVLHNLTEASFSWMEPAPRFDRLKDCPASLLLAWRRSK